MISREIKNRISFTVDKSGLAEAKAALSSYKKTAREAFGSGAKAQAKEEAQAHKNKMRLAKDELAQHFRLAKERKRVRDNDYRVRADIIKRTDKEEAQAHKRRIQEKEAERAIVEKIADEELAAQKRSIQAAKEMRRQYRATLQNVREVAAGVRNLGITLTVSLFAPFVYNMKKAFGETMFFQDAEAGFEVLLNSADKAKSLMGELRTLAKGTIIDFHAATALTNQLLTSGADESKVTKYVTSIGKLAKGDAEKMRSIGLQFSQAMAKGKPDMRDLKVMGEAGVPIVEALAKAMGTDKAGVYGRSSKGEITFEDLERALFALTTNGGKFDKMLDTMREKLRGAVTLFHSALTDLRASIGDDWTPIAKNIVKTATAVLKILSWLPKPLRMLTVAVMGITALLLGPGLMLIGSLGFAVTGLIMLLDRFGISLGLNTLVTDANTKAKTAGFLATVLPLLATIGTAIMAALAAVATFLATYGPIIIGFTTALLGVTTLLVKVLEKFGIIEGPAESGIEKKHREQNEARKAWKKSNPYDYRNTMKFLYGGRRDQSKQVHISVDSKVGVPAGTPASQEQHLNTVMKELMTSSLKQEIRLAATNIGSM